MGSVVVVAEALAVPGFDAWSSRVFAGEDGRFTVLDCPPGRLLTLTLDVLGDSVPRLENVDPRLG